MAARAYSTLRSFRVGVGRFSGPTRRPSHRRFVDAFLRGAQDVVYMDHGVPLLLIVHENAGPERPLTRYRHRLFRVARLGSVPVKNE
jgi:hypothetical protein